VFEIEVDGESLDKIELFVFNVVVQCLLEFVFRNVLDFSVLDKWLEHLVEDTLGGSLDDEVSHLLEQEYKLVSIH